MLLHILDKYAIVYKCARNVNLRILDLINPFDILTEDKRRKQTETLGKFLIIKTLGKGGSVIRAIDFKAQLRGRKSVSGWIFHRLDIKRYFTS